jgi:hypothetical protein
MSVETVAMIENWEPRANEEGMIRYEHSQYDGLIVRGFDLKEDDEASSSFVVEARYRGDLLGVIADGLVSQFCTSVDMEAWMEDHPGLAGIRVNDGVASGTSDGPVGFEARMASEWTEDQRLAALRDLREWGFEQDGVVFDSERDTYYEVAELTQNGVVLVPYHENVRNVDGVTSTTVKRFCERVETGVVQQVSDTVLENPLDILERYAERNVSQDLSELGEGHDYEGIDGVETVGDVRDALLLGRQERKA